MPRPQISAQASAPAFVLLRPRTRYLVARRQDVWFILFDGEEYGPYRSEREAKLFAIDAAHRLGEHGRETEVMVADEAGDMVPAWIHGQHPYPPRA
jgi:hypothetical protein